jgi:TPR repeat protein
MTGERTLQLKPAPAAIAPPASTPAPQSAEAVSPQTNAPETRPEQRQAVTTPVTRAQPPPAQEGGTALRLDSEEITALIDRGSDLLKRGDLASARLFLRRAAEAGSADAALKLGSTFDPTFIQQLGVIGVAPDVARARQWYERAVELGSDAAAQRLANLNNQ